MKRMFSMLLALAMLLSAVCFIWKNPVSATTVSDSTGWTVPTLAGTWNIANTKNRSGAVSGYLSLVCGNNAAIFKDVKIEVLG